MGGTKYKHFYGNQSEQFTFYKVPKQLFVDEKFHNISAEAKLLYGILLDRMSLSSANGWRDEDGKVYIIFTVEEVQTSLGCAEKKAIKLLNELESKCGLIDKVRQGLGKPNIIYVRNFLERGVENYVERQFLNCQNDSSGAVKNTVQEPSKGQCNNTDINNTDISYTDPSFYPENHERKDEASDYYNQSLIDLKEKLEYDSLAISYRHHLGMLDEIFEILNDTFTSNNKVIRIGGDDKPAELVKSKLRKLNYSHIQFVMECMLENTSKVRNIRQYLLTTLYNATHTMDSYYTSLVNHDMYGDY